MRESKAFAPCHITGIFEIFDQSANALQVGSRGAGFSLNQGVETKASVQRTLRSSLQAKINDLDANVEISKHVVKAFLSRFKGMENFEINIEHRVKVPIGAGLGTSGAMALSLALALNEALDLKMSKIEAAQLAHVTEVECKTGLGTVIAETFGGAEIRVKPGAPGIGEIEEIPAQNDLNAVCLVLGPLSTRKCLTDKQTRKRINEIGGKLIDRLIQKPSITNLLMLSRRFAEHVGLITDRTREVLNATDDADFICSMPMFGESVFTLTKQESLEELLSILRSFGPDEKIIVGEVDHKGAQLLQ